MPQIVNKLSQLLLIAIVLNVSIMAKNKEIKNINISLKMAQHCWPL
jgi:hypothetical protein